MSTNVNIARPSKIMVLVTLACCLIILSGCSVFMAARQPEKKNLDVLEKGTPRANVIAELGTPQVTDLKGGKKEDIFAFKQGYSKSVKVGRAFFHGVADIFSMGLWEVVGTPTEMIANGRNVKAQVLYNENDEVEKVIYLAEPKKK